MPFARTCRVERLLCPARARQLCPSDTFRHARHRGAFSVPIAHLLCLTWLFRAPEGLRAAGAAAPGLRGAVGLRLTARNPHAQRERGRRQIRCERAPGRVCLSSGPTPPLCRSLLRPSEFCRRVLFIFTEAYTQGRELQRTHKVRGTKHLYGGTRALTAPLF